MKDIEYVVRNATNTWKNIYLLHKLSDQTMEIKDDDDDSDKDEEETYTKPTHFDNEEDEEDKWEEATEE